MARHLSLASRPATDASSAALDALAEALLPRLLARLGAERRDGELVEVVKVVPLPRRLVLRACRGGRIDGARKVGRRWLATRGEIDRWLRAAGPQAVAAPRKKQSDDDLDEMRARLARGRRH